MTARWRAHGAADHSLHARRQRHAFRDAAGLQFRRPVLRLSEGQLRHALCRRQGGPAAHDEHRPALPAGRAAGPRRRAQALHRLRERPRQGLAGAAHRHRPPLEGDASLPPAGDPAVPNGSRRFRLAVRRHLRAFALDRRARLRAGTRPCARHRRRPAQRAMPRLPGGERQGEARRAERPSRPRRQAGGGEAPDGGIDQGAGFRRPRRADRRRAGAASRSSMPPMSRPSAFPSSSPSRARPRRRSSRPSKPASATTAPPNSTRPAKQVERIALLRLREILPS